MALGSLGKVSERSGWPSLTVWGHQSLVKEIKWNIGGVREPLDVPWSCLFFQQLLLVTVASGGLSAACAMQTNKGWGFLKTVYPIAYEPLCIWIYFFFLDLLHVLFSLLLLPWHGCTLKASAWRTCLKLYFQQLLLCDFLVYYQHYWDMKWKHRNK